MEPIRWRRAMVGVATLFFSEEKLIWSLTPTNQTFQGDLKLYVCKANSHIFHSVCYVSDIFNRFSSMHLKVNSYQTVFFQASTLTAGESRQRASVRMSQYLQSWRTIRPFADLSNPDATSSMKTAPGSAAMYQSQLSQVSVVCT